MMLQTKWHPPPSRLLSHSAVSVRHQPEKSHDYSKLQLSVAILNLIKEYCECEYCEFYSLKKIIWSLQTSEWHNQNKFITMGQTFVSSLLLQLLWYIGGSPPVLRDRDDLRQRKCYTINIKTSYLPFQLFNFLCSLSRIQIHQESTNFSPPTCDLSRGCLWSMVTWPRVALWSPDST